MKTSIKWFGFFWIGLSSAFAAQTTLFEDNFEAGNLDQWEGIPGAAQSGVIVPDPLRAGNHVLTFSNLNAGGDILTAASLPVGEAKTKYVVQFDYLGLPQPDSVPGNLGGFLGIYVGLLEPQYWIAGTDLSGINTSIGVELTDDGAWHHYEIDITSLVQEAGLTSVHLMAEDWRTSGGIPGDAYFDNIQLVAHKRESKLQLYVTEVTLCWESQANQNYQLQYRSSHTPGGWTDVGTPVAGNGGTNCVADHLPVGEPQRFYRVIEAPQQ